MAPPVSLPHSPNETSRSNLLSSSWTPPRTSHSGSARSPSFIPSRSQSIRDQAISTVEKIYRRVAKTWQKLSTLQKALAVFAITLNITIIILFLKFNEKIFSWLEPLAEKWKHTTGGWTILWAITFLTAFPPLIGYSTCGTTAGFVYGVGEGWLILATASVAGSFCSFLVSRTILRKYVERMASHDRRFAALTLTLKQDGLKLLCMIRLCPLPYSLSNGAMSTFHTVHPAMYALATALVSPKLLIHAFIGSRLAIIARSGGEMSTGAKALNWTSVILGGLVGATVGWYIYRKTMARAQELEEQEAAGVRDSVRRSGHLPRRFTDDPEAAVAADTLAKHVREEDDLHPSDDDRPEYVDDPVDDDDDQPHRSGSKTGYHDDQSRDADDVFTRGDGDATNNEDDHSAVPLWRENR